MLFELETIGSPDDGMIAAYTGCVDGNGQRNIAVIDMSAAINIEASGTSTNSDYATALRDIIRSYFGNVPEATVGALTTDVQRLNATK